MKSAHFKLKALFVARLWNTKVEQTVLIWDLWAGGGHKGLARHQKNPAPRLLSVVDLPTKVSLEQKRPGCHSLFHINSLYNEL